MRNSDFFKGKSITIIGLARSGLACANLLFDLGAQVSLSDNQDSPPQRLYASRLKSKDIKLELGKHSREFIEGRDLIVISPGVPINSQAKLWAKELGIPAISEIELAWILCPATIIAVTGSNGKTTTTTLIARVLEAAGKKVHLCGNIGDPFCAQVTQMGESDYVSLEVSSFQLESIDKFKPRISLILNFSCNHLDRHKDLKEYLEAKKRIFMNQDQDDFLVLNQDDPVLRELAKEAKARVQYFSREENLNSDQSAVMAVGSLLKIDPALILKVCRDFKGLPHRLEFVEKINGVKFINDSKATTADSVLWALENIPEPVILIAGGRHKGIDYSIILGAARGKVKEVILLGEAKPKMANVFRGHLALDEAGDLEEAVQKAYQKAVAGDCVLLSPMCSSFDMFADYQQRGDCFKKAVRSLLEEKALK